jgi:hypothetical protein
MSYAAVLVLTLTLLLSSATTSGGIPNSNPNDGFWAATDQSSSNSNVGDPTGAYWANDGRTSY